MVGINVVAKGGIKLRLIAMTESPSAGSAPLTKTSKRADFNTSGDKSSVAKGTISIITEGTLPPLTVMGPANFSELNVTVQMAFSWPLVCRSAMSFST